MGHAELRLHAPVRPENVAPDRQVRTRPRGVPSRASSRPMKMIFLGVLAAGKGGARILVSDCWARWCAHHAVVA